MVRATLAVGALVLLLGACQPKRGAAVSDLDEGERARLNRGIVELTQRLQDAEVKLGRSQQDLQAAHAQLRELGQEPRRAAAPEAR